MFSSELAQLNLTACFLACPKYTKYLIEDYDELSQKSIDVWTLDSNVRNVIFKLEVKSGKVNLIGKEVVRDE